MTGPTAGPPNDDRNTEPYLGGADAVEKTTYTDDEGKQAERRAGPPRTGKGQPSGGSAMSPWAWVAIGLAVLAALIFGLPLLMG